MNEAIANPNAAKLKRLMDVRRADMERTVNAVQSLKQMIDGAKTGAKKAYFRKKLVKQNQEMYNAMIGYQILEQQYRSAAEETATQHTQPVSSDELTEQNV